MDLTSKKDIKSLLKKHNIRPSRRLGQNFLINKSVSQNILQTAKVSSKDTILEIGAGVGGLTQKLAERVKRVIAVEKNEKMVEILKEVLEEYKNVTIIQKDILKFNLKNYHLKPKKYKIVANLPFYITSPVIRRFLEEMAQPELMALIVQKEVAERICAKPPRMNMLAVSVQFYADPEIITKVSRKRSWPSPKVDSAILKITPKQKNIVADRDLFFKIVKGGFSHPRKQLVNNLLALTLPNNVKLTKEQIKRILLRNGIAPNQRAETLTLEEWIRFVQNLRVVL